MACAITSSQKEKLCLVIEVVHIQNMKPLLYGALKSLLPRSLVSTPLSFSRKLHISLLSGGKKAVVLPQPPPSTRDEWKVKPISQCLEFHS